MSYDIAVRIFYVCCSLSALAGPSAIIFAFHKHVRWALLAILIGIVLGIAGAYSLFVANQFLADNLRRLKGHEIADYSGLAPMLTMALIAGYFLLVLIVIFIVRLSRRIRASRNLQTTIDC